MATIHRYKRAHVSACPPLAAGMIILYEEPVRDLPFSHFAAILERQRQTNGHERDSITPVFKTHPEKAVPWPGNITPSFFDISPSYTRAHHRPVTHTPGEFLP